MIELFEPRLTILKDTPVDLNDPKLFVNRELSMLQFQRRVLEEALDSTNPLLERVKFLAIVGSNLDEFFMVRVAGLHKQIESGVLDLAPDRKTPAEQLVAIRKEALDIMRQERECLHHELLPALNRAGIHILNYNQLSERDRQKMDAHFDEVIFPVLTPLAVDPTHPFPHISNLSLNLAVIVIDDDGDEQFARIKVPPSLPRLLPVKRSSGGLRRDGSLPIHHYFVWLEQVISANLHKLFPGMRVSEGYRFRVTRDADLEIQELEAGDLLETMKLTVRQRRFGSVIRLAVQDDMPTQLRDILVENLQVDVNDVYSLEEPLGITDMMLLHSLERPELKYQPFKPGVPERLLSAPEDMDIFSAIRKQDILLHHPYETFDPVVAFLTQAARDPDVLAIKQTLYRVGRNSPVVNALLEASENGKQVAVLVELKARFDEERNIDWARRLEEQGVHVIYGLPRLKIHSKIALVVRKEGEHIRRYVHLSTGNYNAITANLYEDIGMFTCDDEVGEDATHLFNYLTGYSAKKDYRKLLVAPINLRQGMAALIQREIDMHTQGIPGRMILKMNSLVDPLMIQLLYKASMVGVQVDLITRGICCLRPGIPGVSENIRITSVVGRFLEHSRVYYFYNGGREEMYLGSADLMPRNINRRVEVLFPILDHTLLGYLRDTVLQTYQHDNVKARLMQADGTYVRRQPSDGQELIDTQAYLLKFHQRSRKRRA